MTNRNIMYNVAQYKVTTRCHKPANLAKSGSEPVIGVTLEKSYR
jgi:hypothetical protein